MRETEALEVLFERPAMGKVTKWPEQPTTGGWGVGSRSQGFQSISSSETWKSSVIVELLHHRTRQPIELEGRQPGQVGSGSIRSSSHALDTCPGEETFRASELLPRTMPASGDGSIQGGNRPST